MQKLARLFSPRAVAVIGATERPDSVGCAVMNNLSVFAGTVYPINLNRAKIWGLQAFPSITAAPRGIDLAVIATPAPTVPGIIRECVQCGVPAAVILSAGFRECGPAGAKLEQQIMAEAGQGKMRIIGPNCLGVMAPHAQFNATFAPGIARPGSVGFISQSGALCSSILDWSLRENVGFSTFISVGSMLDVGWGDLIDYLGDDPHTKSIVLYMESIGNARAFLSAAREVALTKPIIVIKVGRSEAAAKAAISHTGSLTGSDEVLDAAFRRVGVLRVNRIHELFDMAEALGKQPRPKGPRLAIVTNAGGPGALATDMLIASGGRLADLSPETMQSFNQLLPAHWSHGNPIDILGDAAPDRYAKCVELAAKDPATDGVLVILTPQAMTDAELTAEQLKPFAKLEGKPILASWMGGCKVDTGNAILNSVHVPTFEYPDTAARAFCYMWRYSENLSSIYETPLLQEHSQSGPLACAKVQTLIQTARQAGRTTLSHVESEQILSAYGIPTVGSRIAASDLEAVKLAKEIGYPVVLKLYSHTITHKTEVAGVQLNLRNATEVRRAYHAIEISVGKKVGAEHFLGVTVEPMMVYADGYELILGSSIDPQFGPVLLFGAGGQLVEVFKDRALGLPPLNATLARRMMERTRIYNALKGVRGRKPVDLYALEQLLVRFSSLVIEQPWIKEIDINPLLASSTGLLALDARIVLHGELMTEDQLPKTAIRPYPSQYVSAWKTKNSMDVIIRPIRPEDEPLMVDFHVTLSDRTVYYRYFNLLKLGERVAHERLTRICFNDYDREIALVADHKDPITGQHEILGVGRLNRMRDLNEAEFAIVINDRWQKQGLGTELLSRLVEIGRKEKLSRIFGFILPENHDMQHICKKVGFQLRHKPGEAEVQAEIIC